MIGWTWRRLIGGLRYVGRWYNSRPYWHTELTIDERLKRVEYWIKVHHPLIPTYASSHQVEERGYYEDWLKENKL